MAKYRVVPAFLGGKGKQIFKAFEVIDGDQVKNLDKLIVLGSLIRIDGNESEKTEEIVKSKPLEINLGEVNPIFSYENEKGETVKVFEESDINKKNVVKLLKDKEIEFNQNDSKDVLFALLLENIK